MITGAKKIDAMDAESTQGNQAGKHITPQLATKLAIP